MISAYLLVKRNRLLKKQKAYLLLWKISIDLTTAIYTLATISYFIFAFFISGEFATILQTISTFIDAFFTDSVLERFIFLPMVYLFRAFHHPGVLFTDSEYLLSILPFDRRRIWVLCAIENVIKIMLFTVPVILILYCLSSLSIVTLSMYALLFIAIHILMTIVQWKMFQFHLIRKLIILIVTSAILISNLLFPTISNLLFWLYILSLFFYSVRNVFRHINWREVVTTSDFIVWNMPFISQATKIKFKKDKKLGLWQRFSWWKRPFTYEKTIVYHRLWYLYVEKNIVIILQWTGVLLLLLFIPSYFQKWIFMIVIFITFFIQSSFMMTMAKDRLTSDIVEALPWDWKAIERTFMMWASGLSAILLIPIGIYTTYHYSEVYFLPMIVVVAYAFIYYLYIQFIHYMQLWDESIRYYEWEKWVPAILLLTVLSSLFYAPMLLVGFSFVIIFMIRNKFRKYDLVE